MSEPELPQFVRRARMIQLVERAALGCTRPDYHDKGRTFPWEADIPKELFTAMKEEAEILTVMNHDGTPRMHLLMDYYGTIRESAILSTVDIIYGEHHG